MNSESYTGQMIDNLILMASRVFDGKTIPEVPHIDHALLGVICANCGATYELHSTYGDFCPAKDWFSKELTFTPAQCWHESLESRVGACDGGERCRNNATHESDGAAFCSEHGFPKRDDYDGNNGV